MLRRVNLVVLLGLMVGAVFVFGLTAGAQTEADSAGNEVEEAQQRLAELRMDASAAYEAHGSAVFQLGELEEEIEATTEDLSVTEEDLGEAQARLEDRASRMYKSGNVGFVDVLVGAENFNEFANRLELWVRLLARERAEFDRVREIRDTLAEKKELLEATRDRRVDALNEADTQLDQASSLEADAQAYLDSLNEELRAAMEAEQARQAEQARAAGERLRAEIAAAEPEAVQVSEAPEEIPAPTLTLKAPKEVPAPTRTLAVAPEKTVAAKPVAATVSEPVETPEIDLEAQQRAERQAAKAARLAAEQRAAEQEAAEIYAAEKAAAAEEARLAAQQAAAAEQQQYAAEAAEAERRAELAAQRAAAEQQAAELAAAQQAEAERLAAQQEATEQQQYAAQQEAADQQQYETEQQAANQYEDETTTGAPADEQYDDGGSAAAPAAQPTTAPAPAASASGSAVVSEAAKYMGTPYVLGGPSLCVPYETMDCSCLTLTAYQAFGISLPDDPAAQFGVGVPVSGPPQAGDLVFWAEGGAGITHVGIATGNGTTVHASAYAGYVTETPIDAIPGYVGARRVL